MKNKQKGSSLIVALIVLALVVLWAIGYGLNIHTLFGLNFADASFGELFIRAISIFPLWPLGGIVGWF